MKVKKNIFWIISLALVIVSSLGSCNDEEDTSSYNNKVNNGIKELMQDWYLWYDKVPNINVGQYSNPDGVLNALTYKPIDKWSFVMDTVDFNQYFKEGEVVGFGMGMQLDESENVRVSFVYKNSPMDKQGVTRGYKILKINGKAVGNLINNGTFTSSMGEDKVGVTINFEMQDLSGTIKTLSVSKQVISINTILHRSVITTNNIKVGYIVFESFIETSKVELDEAFAYFKSQGVSELVLDLRYNGGGSLDVGTHLASLIGGSKTVGKEFVNLTFNSKHKAENTPYKYHAPIADLNLSRVFVITTKASASASEAVIVGLKPYIPVYTIGNDTHGKPVGMNIFRIGKYAVAPITFKVINVNGDGEFYSGIKADSYAADNFNYLLGDEQENSLKQALYYINHGSFDNSIARTSYSMPPKQLELTGFRAELGAF